MGKYSLTDFGDLQIVNIVQYHKLTRGWIRMI